jgi:hypothetical protein
VGTCELLHETVYRMQFCCKIWLYILLSSKLEIKGQCLTEKGLLRTDIGSNTEPRLLSKFVRNKSKLGRRMAKKSKGFDGSLKDLFSSICAYDTSGSYEMTTIQEASINCVVVHRKPASSVKKKKKNTRALPLRTSALVRSKLLTSCRSC